MNTILAFIFWSIFGEYLLRCSLDTDPPVAFDDVEAPNAPAANIPKAALDILLQRSATYAKAKGYLLSKHVLMRTAPTCPVIDCGRQMTLIKYKGCADGEKFRCSRHKAKKVAVRKGSYLERSCLKLTDLVKLSYMWAFKTSNKSTKEQLGNMI